MGWEWGEGVWEGEVCAFFWVGGYRYLCKIGLCLWVVDGSVSGGVLVGFVSFVGLVLMCRSVKLYLYWYLPIFQGPCYDVKEIPLE